MKKETQKPIRFLPPKEQLKLRKEIRGFFRFYPDAEKYRPPFEEDLHAWLEGQTWTSLCSLGVFQRKSFIDWAERTLEQVRGLLRKLYAQYDIPPSAVLTLLGYFKIDSLSVDEVRSRKWIQPNYNYLYQLFRGLEVVAIKSRSRAKVVRDAKALRDAARILEQWELPVRMCNDSFQDTYPHGFEVREVARTLDQLARSRAHRPEERQVKTYAKVLAEFFELKAKRPLYGYIGRLLRAGFREKWNPAGDLREAAKKLVKAPFSLDDISRISPLRLSYPSPLGSATEGLREAVWMCSVRGKVVVEVVKPQGQRAG